MPFERLGKVRESLTVNSELYKKHVLRYLEARGYYVKASSDVEGTFADAILTRKGDTREYWLEVKAETVSLNDSEFLKQLGKYLASYLYRTKENRFRMIIACYLTVNSAFFCLKRQEIHSRTNKLNASKKQFNLGKCKMILLKPSFLFLHQTRYLFFRKLSTILQTSKMKI